MRSGKTPTGRSRLSAREEGRREVSLATGPRGEGSASRLGQAMRGIKKGEERPVGLGYVEERERGKRKREWARPKGKKRKKKKCIQMHLNLNLKFKFKWKTNNKTMQWHEMHKTYISLYFFLGSSKLLLFHGKCSEIKIIE
jgi:hypothetical protein